MLLLTLCCFWFESWQTKFREGKKIYQKIVSHCYFVCPCVCESWSFVPHLCRLNERAVCFAVGWARLWRLAVYLLSIRSIRDCTVCFSVEGCPLLYSGPVVLQSQIRAWHLCAWRHFAWLCILYKFGVHALNKVFSFLFTRNRENHNFRLTCPLWDGGNYRFLTPGLTPQSALYSVKVPYSP